MTYSTDYKNYKWNSTKIKKKQNKFIISLLNFSFFWSSYMAPQRPTLNLVIENSLTAIHQKMKIWKFCCFNMSGSEITTTWNMDSWAWTTNYSSVKPLSYFKTAFVEPCLIINTWKLDWQLIFKRQFQKMCLNNFSSRRHFRLSANTSKGPLWQLPLYVQGTISW